MKLRVCRSMCSTCIGRPAQQDIHLGDRVVRDALNQQTFVTCHNTLDNKPGVVEGMGGEQAICRWFYDNHKTDGIIIGEALGQGVLFVPTKERG